MDPVEAKRVAEHTPYGRVVLADRAADLSLDELRSDLKSKGLPPLTDGQLISLKVHFRATILSTLAMADRFQIGDL